jgi:hypothetical protein
MFIAIGIIGALWFVGFVVAPDKNAPPMTQNQPAAVATATQGTAPQQPR